VCVCVCLYVCVCVCYILRSFEHGAYHRNYAILKDKIVTEFTLLEKNEGMEQVKKTVQKRRKHVKKNAPKYCLPEEF